MKYTLIPTAEKQALKHEYHVRALIVFLFMISFAIMIGVISLLPAFSLVYTEGQMDNKTVNILENENKQNGIIDIQNELAFDNSLLKTLSSRSNTSFFDTIQSLSVARGTIKLNSLNLSQESTSTMSITIQGIAPTRNDLLTFKNRLELLALSGKVDLPISELAKSSDITFSLKFNKSLK